MTEKRCSNCLYAQRHVDKFPCRPCVLFSKWEPMTVKDIIYVAGHSRQKCKSVSDILTRSGYVVLSAWIYRNEHGISNADIARIDCKEIDASDVLILLSSPRRVPGGKFVEAGYALGKGKRVVVIGARENMLMWHPAIECYTSIESFIKEEQERP